MASIPAPTVALLKQDVARTIGGHYLGHVSGAVANLEALDIADAEAKLVDDVQQLFHDTFADTCWPACPLHLKHPLWYRDGGWWCERDGVRICSLGELGPGAEPSIAAGTEPN